MKRNFCFVVLLTIALLLGVGTVYAQSSGNFSYGNTGTTHCVLNSGTGEITGGDICSRQSGTSCTSDADCLLPGQSCIIPTGGTAGICGVVQTEPQTCNGGLQAGIKTNGGSGNVFLIRPSAVIGLLTDVSVQKNATVEIGTSSALAGVEFYVGVESLSGQPKANVVPSYAITYASRFVQISTNLFNVLGNLCTLVANPNQVGGVTTAVGCFISFNESTVSAHSFDWIASGLASGYYGITVNWSSSLGNFGISRSLTCVGPVNLTVQQNKVFSFNTPNAF